MRALKPNITLWTWYVFIHELMVCFFFLLIWRLLKSQENARYFLRDTQQKSAGSKFREDGGGKCVFQDRNNRKFRFFFLLPVDFLVRHHRMWPPRWHCFRTLCDIVCNYPSVFHYFSTVTAALFPWLAYSERVNPDCLILNFLLQCSLPSGHFGGGAVLYFQTSNNSEPRASES